jgi:ankyrin repeat protein
MSDKSSISINLLLFCSLASRTLHTMEEKISFMQAIKKGDLAAVKICVEEDNEDVNQIYTHGGFSGTPLIAASTLGHNEIIDYLIEKKADVNLGPTRGTTPIVCALIFRQFKSVDLLLDKGVGINKRIKFTQNGKEYEDTLLTAFIAATADEPSLQQKKEIVAYLLSKKANVNAEDSAGFTPLAHDIWLGYTEIAGLLLDNGALYLGRKFPSPCECESRRKLEALNLAASRGHTELRNFLATRFLPPEIARLVHASECKDNKPGVIITMSPKDEEN